MAVDKVIDYRDLIERSTRGFLGRQWVLEAIDAFLSASEPRYFLLLGEPGAGKTAFLADLVRHRQYPHHFIGAGSQIGVAPSVDWRNPVRFAESLGYQLLLKYGDWVMDWESWGLSVKQTVQDLQGTLVGANVERFNAVPRLSGGPLLTVEQEVLRSGPAARAIGVYVEQFVTSPEQVVRQLLLTPLERIARRWPDQQSVLVLDGLDEAPNISNPAQSIIALLPDGSLPANVRWILSSRPGEHLSHALLNQARQFWLSEDPTGRRHPGALQDAYAFVLQVVDAPPVQDLLLERGLAAEAVAEQVAQASQGNFLYLHHYALGLTDGDVSLLNMATLPRGLYGIYADFLTRIKERRGDVAWDAGYKPVLATLAVAREPLARRQIAAFAGTSEETAASVLLQAKAFLDTTQIDGNRVYAMYHLSFGEYLLSEHNEDYIDGRSAHSRIADHYLNSWGGLAEGLPALHDPNVGTLERYGLRHVVDHLDGAGRWEDLHAAMSLSWIHGRTPR